MKQNVIILGAGFAGLAAATELLSAGYNVTIIEQRGFSGGRAFSFFDKNISLELDNGQHLLMGCYENTFRFLKTISTTTGSDDKLYIQKDLHVDFLDSDRHTYSLSCLPLPAPLHAASGILRFKALSLSERLRMLYITKDVLYDENPLPLTLSHKGRASSHTLEEWGKGEGDYSISEWLDRHHQSARSRDYFWNILTLAVMNENPHKASTAIFKTVLKKAMFRSRKGSGIVLPAVPLSRLYADDAEAFIRQHNGVLEKACTASEIMIEKDKVTGIRTRDGRIFRGDYYISAVPYYALQRLLPECVTTKHHSYFSCLKELISSPIISFYLLFDKPVTSLQFAALVNSPVQWVFNKKMINKTREKYGLISLVISGAQEYVNMSSEQLLNMALTELKKFLPEAGSAKLLYSRIIKERAATFIPSPGIQKYRPSQETPIRNLFLAGDWTDTGLPATIEGAVISGYKCAEMIKQRIFSKNII